MKKSLKLTILPILALAFTTFSCTVDSKENENSNALTEKSKDIAGKSGETLTVTIPNQIVRGQSVVFRGNASSTITKVQLNVGGFDLGAPVNVSMASNGYWSKTYSFSESGNGRTLIVKGLSISGAVLITKTYTINVLNTGTTTGTYIQNVPYFYQRANQLSPYQSCQNTSIAMILKYYAQKEGKSSTVINSETPDKITGIYGKDLAQSVPGFQRVFNERAAALGLAARDAGTTTMSLATFRTKAAAVASTGNPMSVHIYTTSYGHLLNVLGFDGTHYIVHDPYGKWDGGYKSSGYTAGATLGIYIRYTKASFEAAASPDGLVWVHSYQ